MAEYGTAHLIDEAEAELYGLTTDMTGYVTAQETREIVEGIETPYVNVYYAGIIELIGFPRDHFTIVEFAEPIWDQP